ncbi:MAG: hypothetical protein WDZ76_14715 [Pseudohongiellaceae bacterium]
MRLLRVIFPIYILTYSSLVGAQDLTADIVTRVMDSLYEVMEPVMASGISTVVMFPPDKQFAPKVNTVEYVKQNNKEVYDQMNTAAKRFGFVSSESWAQFADRISNAELLLQREADGTMIPDIPPNAVVNLGPSREAGLLYLELIRALNNVPTQDKEVVAPLVPLFFE